MHIQEKLQSALDALNTERATIQSEGWYLQDCWLVQVKPGGTHSSLQPEQRELLNIVQRNAIARFGRSSSSFGGLKGGGAIARHLVELH